MTLYGSWVSPPCVKIRAVLAFYGVFTRPPNHPTLSFYAPFTLLPLDSAFHPAASRFCLSSCCLSMSTAVSASGSSENQPSDNWEA